MIGATVVLYKPELHKVNLLIESTINQVDFLTIIDNSPTKNIIEHVSDKVFYHHYPENVGIASAHNLGLKELISNGCEYVMLLDQDSSIADDQVFRLSSLLVASKLEERPLVAIGPRIICSFSERSVKPRVQREIAKYDELVCVTQIISSGMMIDTSKLELVGFKDENLFIDGVDHEWCWRAKTKDYMVAIAENVEMVHRLGDARKKFAGVTYKVGSPIRLYYQFRNILLLIRRGYVPNYWKARNICVLPIRFFANSLLQEHRMARTKYMLQGLWDGLFGKNGAHSDNWK